MGDSRETASTDFVLFHTVRLRRSAFLPRIPAEGANSQIVRSKISFAAFSLTPEAQRNSLAKRNAVKVKGKDFALCGERPASRRWSSAGVRPRTRLAGVSAKPLSGDNLVSDSFKCGHGEIKKELSLLFYFTRSYASYSMPKRAQTLLI